MQKNWHKLIIRQIISEIVVLNLLLAFYGALLPHFSPNLFPISEAESN
jgi:hypothetical protein